MTTYLRPKFGTNNNDTLHGTGGNDSIYGRNGNDTIYGKAGNDWLAGDAGNDRISGGDGADKISGGDGNDWLVGDAGNDIISGNNGDDKISGGTGDDIMFGGNGKDIMQGNEGSDKISGEAGDDYLFGREGDDALSGGAGNDHLFGDNGMNILEGGPGLDSYHLTPGAENADTILIYKGDSDLSLSNLTLSFDKVYDFDMYDKLDLPSAGVMADASVNATYPSAHFNNISISNGILTLNNGVTPVAIDSPALVKEAIKFVGLNFVAHSLLSPNGNSALLDMYDHAVAIQTTIGLQAHTLIVEPHSTGTITVVDVVGSMTSLLDSQII